MNTHLLPTQGFIQRGGGGAGIPPPRNLEIEYGYYCGAINISYLILNSIKIFRCSTIPQCSAYTYYNSLLAH